MAHTMTDHSMGGGLGRVPCMQTRQSASMCVCVGGGSFLGDQERGGRGGGGGAEGGRGEGEKGGGEQGKAVVVVVVFTHIYTFPIMSPSDEYLFNSID